MSAHRPGVRLGDQFRERDAARRGGVTITVDHDQDPTYSAACFPEGWDTDPSRHTGEDANPCYGLLVDVLVTHHCRGCTASFHGTSEDEVRRQVLEHQGRGDRG